MKFFKKHHYTFFYPIPVLSVYNIVDAYLSQPSGLLETKSINGRCTSVTTFDIIAEGNGSSFQSYQSPMEGELWEVKQGCFLHLLIKPSWTTYLMFYVGIFLFTISLLHSLVTNNWNSIPLVFLLPLGISTAGIIKSNVNASTAKESFLRYLDSEIRSKIYVRHQVFDVHTLIEEIIVRYLYYGGSNHGPSQNRDYTAIASEIMSLVKTPLELDTLTNHLMDLQASGLGASPDRSYCSHIARMIIAVYQPK